MPDYFFDSSALVKAYVKEQGSAFVAAIADPNSPDDVFVSRLTGVEVMSTLARRHKDHSLNEARYAQAVQALTADWKNSFRVLEFTVAVGDTSMRFSRKYALKGAGCAQLATAWEANQVWLQLQLPALTFVSADDELNAAAPGEGFTLENPNTRP
jgi:predicted nucleic acid-binding protein